MADYIKISLLGEVFLALWIGYIPKTKAIGIFLMAFVMGITKKNIKHIGRGFSSGVFYYGRKAQIFNERGI